MKVLSVNIGERKKVTWRFKTIETGIFKKPIEGAIFLKNEHVKNDNVVDKKHHGGEDMAVYAYTINHYDFFQKLHPKLTMNNGIFGENLTVSNLLETQVYIGDIFKIGEAVIQVSQPRFPCFKLGIVFGTQKIIKQYLNTTFCGFYFRIIEEGHVKKGDSIVLIKKAENSMTVAEVYSLKSSNRKNKEMIQRALELEFLAERCKKSLKKLL